MNEERAIQKISLILAIWLVTRRVVNCVVNLVVNLVEELS